MGRGASHKKARSVRSAGCGGFHSFLGVREGFFLCRLEVQGGSFRDRAEFLLDSVDVSSKLGRVYLVPRGVEFVVLAGGEGVAGQ